ncbi:thiamine pyrophosphate-dependent enzyme [Variovorax sp. R-27]
MPDLDFVALAGAQGMKALRVETAEQLRAALHQALQSAAPMLVEVEVA